MQLGELDERLRDGDDKRPGAPRGAGPGAGTQGEDGTCQDAPEERAAVRIDEQAFARAAELIAHDLTATLGWGGGKAQAEARAALGNRLGRLPTRLAWDEFDPATQREVLDEVVVGAVEDLQQFVHDTCVDTSWPACPRHPNHPMWLAAREGGGSVWCCLGDEAEIAPLGMLPGSAPPPCRDP
jgi:hypothetical protein